MANDRRQQDGRDVIPSDPGDEPSIREVVVMLLTPVASLKFTVALFALSIFLVLAGTLAQVNADINTVMKEYFRSWMVLIELRVFFPPSFFPPVEYPNLANIEGAVYFPGGRTIGCLLFANLLAAHGLRFKPQARGTRLKMGLGAIAFGMFTTWLVIASGSNKDGIQGQPIIDWKSLWLLFEIGLALLCAGIGYAAANTDRQRKIQRWSLATLCALLAVFLTWLIVRGEAARFSDASMRITWQLVKATSAAIILLAGCTMIFKKRAGIVLLHAGVGLIMFNELYVSLTAVENQMQIEEGETVNYVYDVSQVELAVVDRSDEEHDVVTVVPEAMLKKPGQQVRDERLPFDLKIVRYLKNSDQADVAPGDVNPADAGFGLRVKALEKRAGTGTDSGGEVDVAALYATLSDKQGQPLGTYLFRQFLFDQQVVVGEKSYDVALRFKRTYTPYSMHLIDARKDDYVGTNRPRNYSSQLHLVDESRDVDRPDIKIWMNNPLRYAGETFYQSNWAINPSTGKEVTTLSVVTNAGWMIPYVGCMIVAVGMVAQFYWTLTRFMSRRIERKSTITVGRPVDWIVPAVAVLVCLGFLASRLRPPQPPEGRMDLVSFGQLPVAEQGRVKPLDSLARNSLRVISNRETFVGRMDDVTLREKWSQIDRQLREKWPRWSDADADDFTKDYDVDRLIDTLVAKTGEPRGDVQEVVEDLVSTRQPAIRWLADVMTDAPDLIHHRVFRIENGEIRDLLKLPRRKGLRYSVAELRENLDEFEKQARRARDMEPEQHGLYERKLMELSSRISTFTSLNAAFRPPPLPTLPTAEEVSNDPATARLKFERFRAVATEHSRQLRMMEPPCLVPLDEGEVATFAGPNTTWQPYSTALIDAVFAAQLQGRKPKPQLESLLGILSAYDDGDVQAFNQKVGDYHEMLKSEPPAEMTPEKVRFESRFNQVAPFDSAAALYVLAFVLAVASWLGWTRPLSRTAFCLIAVTLVVHSLALVGRIYISGRPPVTNLYSSAVFIGWAAVVAGLILEAIFRMGIGNVVASVAGFSTLRIAYSLAFDGDTLGVMQAVLDTQFWLTTHVVCVTLGYAATFVAGLLGILYILGGLANYARNRVFQPVDKSEVGRHLTRMTYGVVCFAIFFSFFGTVLGGLWADDSWGRFWGWDPKENGALIIVIWNALVLHARWGAMIKDRGLAVLVVGGNIATSWSWFGVNELGVGLHSYGFTDGVLQALGLFVASQLVVMACGSIPLKLWKPPGEPKTVAA